MRVAIVCGAGIVSGKEVMALELGQGLREAGADVHFVTSRWASGEFGRRSETAGFPTYFLWLGFISATLRLDCIWMTVDQLRRWPSLLVRYRRFLRSVRPSKVVHTNWHHVLLLWPLLRPDRDIYWLHEVMPNKLQYRRLFRGLVSRISGFVAVSRAVAKSLTDMGVPAKNVRVIYNGISDPTEGFRPNSKSIPVIGIVGQIGRWKGHEDLLEAFQTVLLAYPNAQLHIFGKGSSEYEAVLRRRATELGVVQNVMWRGFVQDRPTIYNGLDILAIPSRFEDALPTAAIEAAFFEVPVVASRRGGLGEIVEDGVTGYLFKDGDTAKLAQHLNNLLANAHLRRAIGKNARDRAITLFSHERFVRDFCDLLEIESRNARQNGRRIDNAA